MLPPGWTVTPAAESSGDTSASTSAAPGPSSAVVTSVAPRAAGTTVPDAWPHRKTTDATERGKDVSPGPAAGIEAAEQAGITFLYAGDDQCADRAAPTGYLCAVRVPGAGTTQLHYRGGKRSRFLNPGPKPRTSATRPASCSASYGRRWSWTGSTRARDATPRPPSTEEGSALASFDDEQILRIGEITNNNWSLTIGYEPEVFDGDVLLFVATPDEDALEGMTDRSVAKLQRFDTGTVEVEETDCEHRELLQAGPVAVVGRAVQQRLNGLRDRPRTPRTTAGCRPPLAGGGGPSRCGPGRAESAVRQMCRTARPGMLISEMTRRKPHEPGGRARVGPGDGRCTEAGAGAVRPARPDRLRGLPRPPAVRPRPRLLGVRRGRLPFGAADANPEYSAFQHVGRDQLAPWIAGWFLGSAAVALLLALPGRRRIPAGGLVGASVVSAAVVFFTLADFRILGNLAYVFMLKFGAINWTVINQLFAVVSVGLMVVSAVIYQRRTSGACTRCGRSDAEAGWTSRESAARWGKRAAYTAVVVPLLYASTRWAWALGFPLGISDELWEEGKRDHLWIAGAALATMGALGSLLTLGLVQRWGEVFPRWMVGLRGMPLLISVVSATPD